MKCDHPKQMQLVCVPDKGQTAPRYQFCYIHAVGRHTADPKFWAFTGLILRACAWIAECATTVSGAKSSISGVFHLLHQLRHGGLVGFSGTENCFFVIVAINLPYLFHGQNLPLRQQSPVKCFRWAAVRPNGPLRPSFQTVPEDRRCPGPPAQGACGQAHPHTGGYSPAALRRSRFHVRGAIPAPANGALPEFRQRCGMQPGSHSAAVPAPFHAPV